MKLTTFCVQVMGQIQAFILQIQTVILEIKIVILQTLFVILQIQAVSQHIQKQFDVVHFNLLHFFHWPDRVIRDWSLITGRGGLQNGRGEGGM